MAKAAPPAQRDDDDEVEAAPAPKKKASKTWLWVAIGIVITLAVSLGGSFFLMRHLISDIKPAAEAGADGEAAVEAVKEEPKRPPNFVPMEPAFVVNLDAPGESRFLQVQVQLMTRDAKAVDVIKLYEPQLRNALLLLFSQQTPADVATRAGVEKLQVGALAEVQRVLAAETDAATVDALYFTSFVAQ